MSVEVKVWSDFVCPFCMIAEKPLLDAIKESGVDVKVEWMPFELRPFPTPTLRPEDSYLQTVWPQSVYPLAERYGVQIKLPSVSPQPHTELAWEGYQFAREEGKANAYTDRVMTAFFQEDQDIGDLAVLTHIAGEIGLDEAEFEQVLSQRTYQKDHQRALEAAEVMQITAVPTFLVGPYRFSGVQPKDILLEALHDAEGQAGRHTA